MPRDLALGNRTGKSPKLIMIKNPMQKRCCPSVGFAGRLSSKFFGGFISPGELEPNHMQNRQIS